MKRPLIAAAAGALALSMAAVRANEAREPSPYFCGAQSTLEDPIACVFCGGNYDLHRKAMELIARTEGLATTLWLQATIL
jgi:hypothetical protein